MEPTYRVVSLANGYSGKTAATPELAKLAAGDLDRSERLGLEQTYWEENFGKPKASHTVLIAAPSGWPGLARPSTRTLTPLYCSVTIITRINRERTKRPKALYRATRNETGERSIARIRASDPVPTR
jgi:hypothetical protein